MKLTVGQSVLVPCSVAPGAFSGESLVTIEFGSQRVSGFVGNEFVTGEAICGMVLDVAGDEVTFRMPGSFFTLATGTATVPSDWASRNLRPAA